MEKVVRLSAISVQAASPTRRYGALAYMNISDSARMLARPSLAGIPSNAVVSSATLTLRNRGLWSGTRTLSVARALTGWSTATTWRTIPTSLTGAVSQTQTNASYGTWTFNVTSHVQAWVSGAAKQHGFVVFSSAPHSGRGVLYGSPSATHGPVLTIEYLIPAQQPDELLPSGGTVSTDKPVLGFNVGEDTLAIQVQIDPAGDEVAPDWDSGEVPATAGLLDLAETTYPGLADAASTMWRARAKNALGWSAWSDWADFSRSAKAALTINTPAATTEDSSPVVTWTFAGVQDAWRVLLYNERGRKVYDSGWTPGTETEVAPGVNVGAEGRVVVQVQDDVDRAATTDDPEYVQAAQSFVVAPSGTPSPLSDLTASQDGVTPGVVLTGHRAEIPDEVVIYQGDTEVARLPGVDVFNGTTMVYEDWTARMNVETTYTVRAVVNGQWSNVGPSATITPTCSGIWLLNTEDQTRAVLWGQEEGEQTQPEVAVVHQPITSADGEVEVIRRRLLRYPRQGTVAGVVVDTPDVPASMSETNLRAWAEEDAGTLYRLVLGDLNDVVILGDLSFREDPRNGPGNGRVLNVSANWWARRV
jgi:hypothetical protein